jgi:hypothetical protein
VIGRLIRCSARSTRFADIKGVLKAATDAVAVKPARKR